ncbi:MAG: outer membrane beta-barrel protein [Bacteroidales bacterium]|nr:outer membrane beta-barrel protein [Bacteroidales bacterium]
MKKIFAILVAAAAMLFAAQTASAQLYFGGSIGLTTTTSKQPVVGNPGQFTNTTGASVRFIPEVGYKINDRIGVGGRIGYGTGAAAFGDMDPNDAGLQTAVNEMQNDLANANNLTTSFTFAPYFRYYIYDGRRFSFFAEAVVLYGLMNMKAKDANGVWQDAGKLSMFELGAKPGFSINFDNHFAIVGHLGFLGFQSLANPNTDASMSRFGLSMSTNSLTVGFVYSL